MTYVPRLKDKRIFIFEDNLTNRSIMQLLLEREGAEISFERWGTNVAESLRKFEPIDIILLDLMFPNNISGYDVFDTIREIPDFDDVPIVAVSASEPEIAIPKTQSKGFAGFISKPILRYELFTEQMLTIMGGDSIWYTG